MPKPRKLNADSVRIALPTRSVAATMIGLAAFGKMCRQMMRPFCAPDMRAASTNSFAFNDKNCPRTKRAAPIHDSAPMMTMIGIGPPLISGKFSVRSNCAQSNRIKRFGIESMKSLKRISPLSIHPP